MTVSRMPGSKVLTRTSVSLLLVLLLLSLVNIVAAQQETADSNHLHALDSASTSSSSSSSFFYQHIIETDGVSPLSRRATSPRPTSTFAARTVDDALYADHRPQDTAGNSDATTVSSPSSSSLFFAEGEAQQGHFLRVKDQALRRFAAALRAQQQQAQQEKKRKAFGGFVYQSETALSWMQYFRAEAFSQRKDARVEALGRLRLAPTTEASTVLALLEADAQELHNITFHLLAIVAEHERDSAEAQYVLLLQRRYAHTVVNLSSPAAEARLGWRLPPTGARDRRETGNELYDTTRYMAYMVQQVADESAAVFQEALLPFPMLLDDAHRDVVLQEIEDIRRWFLLQLFRQGKEEEENDVSSLHEQLHATLEHLETAYLLPLQLLVHQSERAVHGVLLLSASLLPTGLADIAPLRRAIQQQIVQNDESTAARRQELRGALRAQASVGVWEQRLGHLEKELQQERFRYLSEIARLNQTWLATLQYGLRMKRTKSTTTAKAPASVAAKNNKKNQKDKIKEKKRKSQAGDAFVSAPSVLLSAAIPKEDFVTALLLLAAYRLGTHDTPTGVDSIDALLTHLPQPSLFTRLSGLVLPGEYLSVVLFSVGLYYLCTLFVTVLSAEIKYRTLNVFRRYKHEQQQLQQRADAGHENSGGAFPSATSSPSFPVYLKLSQVVYMLSSSVEHFGLLVLPAWFVLIDHCTVTHTSDSSGHYGGGVVIWNFMSLLLPKQKVGYMVVVAVTCVLHLGVYYLLYTQWRRRRSRQAFIASSVLQRRVHMMDKNK